MCLIKVGRIDGVMHIRHMQCSRVSTEGAVLLCPHVSLPGGEPGWPRAFRGELRAFHLLPKLNHVPRGIDFVPEQILFQASLCNPTPAWPGPT